MDTPEKPASKRRISLSETKKALEAKARKEVEANLHAELKKIQARKSVFGSNASYSVSRYADNLETTILTEYLGSYNTKPSKTLPAIQEFEVQTKDRIMAQIASTLLDPQKTAALEKVIANHLEAYIARHISEAASKLSQQFLKDIMDKYETTKLLEVELDEGGDTQ